MRARRLTFRLFAAFPVAAFLALATPGMARSVYFYPPPARLADGTVVSSPVTFNADQLGAAFPRVREMAGVALLVTWSQLCPARDTCDFTLVDRVLDYWRARGKHVVLGVATVGFPYRVAGDRLASATPGWVLDEVSTYRADSLVLGRAAPARTRFPSYADPKFAADVATLLRRLARYDGDPAIAQLRIATGLLTEDDPSPAGLDYVIPGFGDADWLTYCRRTARLFQGTFHRTMLEFDIGRLAIAYEMGGTPIRQAIDDFMNGLIRSRVMLAFNGLRSTTLSALDGAGRGDGTAYAARVLERARARGDAIGLELYAPSPDPAMRNRAAIVAAIRRVRPSRIVAFSTEAAMARHARGDDSAVDADTLAWVRAQPNADEAQAQAEALLHALVDD